MDTAHLEHGMQYYASCPDSKGKEKVGRVILLSWYGSVKNCVTVYKLALSLQMWNIGGKSYW